MELEVEELELDELDELVEVDELDVLPGVTTTLVCAIDVSPSASVTVSWTG